MGLYDTIIVEEDLPITDDMKRLNIDTRLNLKRLTYKDKRFDEMCSQFQTKDFNRCLVTYLLRDKKLYSENYITDTKEEPHLEEIPFHGAFNFYTGINDIMDRWDVWVEYKAIFNHGNLENIELVEFRQESNEERRNKEIKWKMLQDYERNLWRNKYFFHKKWWRKFQFNIWYKCWCKLADICYKIAAILP